MSRSFPLTSQVHALDLHRPWLGSLVCATLLMLAWIVWTMSDRVELFAKSTRVEVEPRVTRRTVVEAHGNNQSVRVVRQRRLTADFAADAAGRVQPGQAAVVRVSAEAGTTRTTELPATVTDVDVDGTGARAVLWVQLPEHQADPLERAGTVEVAVTVASTSRLGFLAFGPNGPATVANGPGSHE